LSAAVAEGLCPSCLTRSVFANDDEPPAEEIGEADQPQRIGDYELIERIARGGMGVVYRARQISLDREVAVKILLDSAFATPDELARFRAEAAAAAALQHPNIVAVHEIGEEKGRRYFSMDFVAGKDLAALTRDGPLPPRQAAELVAKVADAIRHTHERGILHRDLKPSNVLVDALGEPRVTDFGLAKRVAGRPSGPAELAHQADAAPPLTLTGQVIGTPGYMSPEQATAKRDIGPATDLYSLGALLYQLITGRAPFVGETPTAVLRQVEESEPVSPCLLNPSVSADLETICLKCLAKEPERRYASARELDEDLRRYLAGEPILARPISATQRAWRWCCRRPAIASLAAVVASLLGIVAFGAVLSAQRFRTDREAEAGLRAEAESRLRQGERLINFMLGDLVKGLEPVGRLDVLESAIAEVDRFYSETPPENMPLEAQRHRANALFQFGEIRSRQGRLPAALTNYDAAINAYSRLVSAAPTNLAWQNELARAWNSLGIAFAMQKDFTNAAVALGRALAGREHLRNSQPTNPEWLSGYAATAQNLGQVQRNLGKLDQAEDLLRRAEKILQRWIETEPESLATRDRLATVKGSIGQLLAARGKLNEAAAAYSEKAQIHRALLRKDPQNTSWQANLARGLGYLGALQNQQTNFVAAVATLNEAIDLHEGLVARDPANREWEMTLTAQLLDRATALRAQRQPAAALESLRRVWSLSEAQAEGARQYKTWMNNWRQSLEDGAALERELAAQAAAAGKTTEAADHERGGAECQTKLRALPQ
jgi:tetratricopeptide (TPR) repeat protein